MIIKTDEQILAKNFTKKMKNKDFKAFKRDYPTLLEVIKDSMIDCVVQERLTNQLTKLPNNE